ncbi:MAG: 16S rRNA (uracil(1498)-N(3))-methyltransferase [Oligoflexia bacterium]|nr:16S rRNA (uracil(1498)-N(3))-methyltransferase [Oligoflexia bacterium]
MKRVLSKILPTPGQPVRLAEAEAEHAVKVLRLRDGDQLEALDGLGKAAIVTLRTRGGGAVFLELAEGGDQPIRHEERASPPVVLEMAVLKGDAMEWVVEKAVELGVRSLIPTVTAHTVVQLRQKGPEAFRERWQKIADQALKQCGRLESLRIELPRTLEELLTTHPGSPGSPRLWCDEAGRDQLPYLPEWIAQHEKNFSLYQSLHLLIGPEGGWSPNERELLTRSAPGTVRVGLGPWVLRAETAAIFGTSWLTGAFRRA